MYLNQFTNTKQFLVRAPCPYDDKKRLQWIICSLCVCMCVCARVEGRSVWGRGIKGREYLQYFFFLLQNDMRYIIPYSFSQQNEFYKVLYIIQKMSQFHKKLLLTPSLSFTASVPLQNYLQVFKYIHPLLSIESH